jgi:diadenosine tetraphosphate (Ap4A) HIT family hydrolase
MDQSCPFCKPKGSDIVLQNTHCYARYDGFPVSPGHLLIVPFRHEPNFFALQPEERAAGMELLHRGKELLEEQRRPDGFNVGINIGQAAGQTVWHAHVHLIPRYKGDIDNPRGGVRGVIPKNRIY